MELARKRSESKRGMIPSFAKISKQRRFLSPILFAPLRLRVRPSEGDPTENIVTLQMAHT